MYRYSVICKTIVCTCQEKFRRHLRRRSPSPTDPRRRPRALPEPLLLLPRSAAALPAILATAVAAASSALDTAAPAVVAAATSTVASPRRRRLEVRHQQYHCRPDCRRRLQPCSLLLDRNLPCPSSFTVTANVCACIHRYRPCCPCIEQRPDRRCAGREACGQQRARA